MDWGILLSAILTWEPSLGQAPGLPPQPLERPPIGHAQITVGELWARVSNEGQIDGFIWPGGTFNFYLYRGHLWIGARIGEQTVVTTAEWLPSDPNRTGFPVDDSGFVYTGPGKADFDAVAIFDDYLDNTANRPGRHTGLMVITRAMGWTRSPYNNLIAFEYFITYNKEECDIVSPPPDTLTQVVVAWYLDCDVSGADPLDPYVDDLVCYDGWTDGEWDTLSFFPSPTDSLTILRDTVIEEPDLVPDQFFVWGDDPDEPVVPGGGYPITIRRNGRDTTIIGYLIPRNLSYMYDGDNPMKPGDDIGEGGVSAGYIGLALLYAPPSPNDLTSDSVSGIDRVVRPLAHQWWNWESQPANDEARYAYMIGNHPFTAPYRFAPHPYDFGGTEFDYRFLLSAGPYDLADGDTLKFIVIGAVGQGLNGGADTVYRAGAYVLGLRQLIEWAYVAYYTGSGADPGHPDLAPPIFGGPDGSGDIVHWQLPVQVTTPPTLPLPLSLSVKLLPGLEKARAWLGIPARSRISLSLYNTAGRRVARIFQGEMDAGLHSIEIDLSTLRRGIYFVRLEAGEKGITRPLPVLHR